MIFTRAIVARLTLLGALRFFAFFLLVFFAAGRLYSVTHACPVEQPSWQETYDRQLGGIRNIDAAEAFVRGRLPANASQTQIATAIDSFVRSRFYHHYSENRFCDADWLARIAGIFWSRLDHPVAADGILKHPDAYCSQQTLVFNALAERFGLHYAYVRFGVIPGAKYGGIHMTPAVLVDGKWRMYDPDLEINDGSIPLGSVLDGTGLQSAYNGVHLGQSIDLVGALREQARKHRIDVDSFDRYRAAHGAIATAVLLWLSKHGWAAFLILWLALTAIEYRGRLSALARRSEPAGSILSPG